MKRVSKIFNNIEEYLVVILLFVMTVVVFWQVICRFVLKASLPWSEEISRYILVWASFLGASIGVKRGAHIGVEAFTMILPAKLKKFVQHFAIILSVLFCLIVFKESLSIIQKQIINNQVSPAMRIPMWWAYAAIPTGMILMAIRFLQTMVKISRHSTKEAN
ncbi:TRAP transporter small permease [Thermosediminibacter litoriperuensis]|uniref:C4-dicarboxylate transporter DctQ subunit n=1 Tax=Thermosediminibacter litoriperuensis TaxID=291989 RepID=A0A5S5AVK3_9FIRM|nr:TRAP transporter small permease [Thermosediminibacter litoriperuensis]TYP55450.1 C4-dicarboxylate transporter DctQ subunit [Thermosediminibacter litoriperuensis]